MDSCETILARLKKESNSEFWKDLASKLGISQENLSAYRKKGNIPFEYIIDFCLKKELPLDLIFTGHKLNGETLSDREEYVLDRYRSDPAIRKLFDAALEACDANKKNSRRSFDLDRETEEEA